MTTTPSVASGRTGWTTKKVLGVPALYLALGFVLVLAVFAWKMQSTPKASDDSADVTPAESSDDTILRESETYPALPLGTVTAPPPTPAGPSNTTITSNDDWLRKGVAFLITRQYGPGDAQQALSLYLEGGQLTYAQGQMRDLVIREYGIPPYPTAIGGTLPDIARTQGPLPRDHIVKGSADDTANELAALYYNRSDSFAVAAVSGANGGRATYTVGTTVRVPVLPTPATTTPTPTPVTTTTRTTTPVIVPYQPLRYYTVVKGDTLYAIAKRYYGDGSKYTVIASANKIANPNLIYPGQRLRIPYL
jgi:LysM repeat protein